MMKYKDYKLASKLNLAQHPRQNWILITFGRWTGGESTRWGDGRCVPGHPRFSEFAVDDPRVVDPEFEPQIILVQINHTDPSYVIDIDNAVKLADSFVVDVHTQEVWRYPKQEVSEKAASTVREILAHFL